MIQKDGPATVVTAEEFLRGYAERSGVTPAWLLEHGQVVQRCDCGEPECLGWQLVTDDADYDDGA